MESYAVQSIGSTTETQWPKVDEPATPTYHQVFVGYMTNGLKESLARIQRHDNVVPDSDLRQALLLLDRGLQQDEAWDASRELLLELAPKMEQMGYRAGWIPYLERGIEQSNLQSDRMAAGTLHYQHGLLHRLIGRHDKARSSLEKSEQIFAEVGEPEHQAKALNQLAYVAWQQGQAEETIRCANCALLLLPKDHIESAMAYSVLGLIAVEQWQFEGAEKNHRKALTIRQKHGNIRLIAWSLQNLGVALSRQENFAEAIQHYEDALELLESIGDTGNLGIVHLNLGLAKHYANRFFDALRNYANASTIFKTLNDRANIARLLMNQGLTHFALNELSDAEICFSSAVQLFSEQSNDMHRLNATDGLIMTEIAQQNFTEANKHLSVALVELEALPELPNHKYLADSFRNRQKTLKKYA